MLVLLHAEAFYYIAARPEAVDVRHVYPLPKFSLHVLLVVRIDLVLRLSVPEVELDVLVRFPGGHEPLAENVGAAEADEGAGQGHNDRFV